MNESTIDAKVRAIFADYSSRPAGAISAADTLAELGLGDLDGIEIGLDIEDFVDAEGSDDRWEACKTVGDFIQYAQELAGFEAVAV